MGCLHWFVGIRIIQLPRALSIISAFHTISNSTSYLPQAALSIPLALLP